MTSERSTVQIDQRAMRALAHPLRVRLQRMLRADGPATATRLAGRLGESTGLVSYHLRKLAEVGLVEEEVERGTRRERWWRSVHEISEASAARFLGDPATHQASVEVRREVYQWQSRLLEQWLAEEAEWDEAWVDAAGPSDDALFLTPAETRAMSQEIWAIVQRYRGLHSSEDGPDIAKVVWLQHLVPVRGELPL